ncbi:MAG: hypothetical protein GWM90_17795 [Gemmatimonadetes bacterium]|nr:hypothetical protein [Gemmatimonadota bacterium]NIQ56203.1 hypothetical protein [Gemmatimonadota bacterium]NIX45876.1 hypothetical protein [Gemmatimonadota bacterium]
MMVRRSGQALVEYVLITALVALTLVGVLLMFRDTVGDLIGVTVVEEVECVTPGHGGENPGRDGGAPPGQCKE